ncbi:guanylate kinase [Bacteroides fragilis]|uniref:Guanylate kinase n=1 Tax=Bacteroides fragilis TaxID=817 RepID=A0A396BVS0_BACFG|nr:guanylate kinase [Bacteroides fragilis]RHH07875.1 guanylate kinase [Bacteroides fragilis]
MKPIIIAIVGNSGSGKTYMAEFLRSKLNVPVIVSYTTRPMREGETEGKDHFFIQPDKVPASKDMLAYTRFGGYEYFALYNQFPTDGICAYVIDEKGLEELTGRCKGRYEIISILVLCPPELLIARGIDPARVKRDHERKHLSLGYFDCVIRNDASLEEFEYKVICEFNKL